MGIGCSDEGARGRRGEHLAQSVYRILFPTDFSLQAAAAWPHAVGLARVRGAELHLVHVFTPPVLGWIPEATIVASPVIDDMGLNELAGGARSLGVATWVHTRVGDAASGILDCAAEEGIDVIVMGTTGRTGVAHVLMGSVAELVVRHAACPVLTVRHEPRVGPPLLTGALPHVGQILVPLDGSPLTEAALSGVVRLAVRHGSTIRLLRVVQVHALRAVDLEAAQVRCIGAAEAYLAGIERRLAAEGLTTSNAVRYGETVPEILDDLQVNHPDLVAMSTHGRTGFLHLVLGSVAEQLLRASDAPVLLFPPCAVDAAWSAAAHSTALQ
jgi:nucleotide-binding universal stress UspA family protein